MPKSESGSSWRAALKGSAGFTLIELLMAMALTVVVMAAAGTVLYSVQRSSNADTEDANAQVEAQTSLDRMVRELRQAVDVTQSDPNQMTVTLLDGTQLSYKCDTAGPAPNASYNACYRLTAAAGAALPTPTAAMARIVRIANPAAKPVFTYTLPSIDDASDSDDDNTNIDTATPPSPVYVAVHIETPAKGELAAGGRIRTITLDSGFELRNVRYIQSSGAGS